MAAAFVYCYGKEPTLEAALAAESLKTEIGCELSAGFEDGRVSDIQLDVPVEKYKK